MAEPTKDRLLEHEYDGIQEYDNPCPTWWHLLFAGTVVFSLLYYAFFQLGNFGWTIQEAYEAAVAKDLERRFGEIGELKPDQATLVAYMNQPEWLSVGAKVFATHCKSCHGEDGSGGVGPNLTDDHYKNVKELTDIAQVIEQGAANGSMPPWRNGIRDVLHPNEVVLVAAYVAKMRGQNLPGPRGPEGEEIAPWPTAEEVVDAKPAGEKVEENEGQTKTPSEATSDSPDASSAGQPTDSTTP